MKTRQSNRNPYFDFWTEYLDSCFKREQILTADPIEVFRKGSDSVGEFS